MTIPETARRADDVLIIGAGLAGLAAAQRLGQSGKSVTVLEARERIGGRVFSHRDTFLGRSIELGAEWIDGTGAVAELLRRHGCTMQEATGRRWQRMPSGLVQAKRQYDPRMLSRLRGWESEDAALAVALRVCCADNEFDAARNTLLGYVEGFHAADPNYLSLRWFLEAESNQPAEASQLRATEGADHVADALRSDWSDRVELQLGAVVKRIRWEPGRVEVEAECDGAVCLYTAQTLVCTLPLSLLQSSPEAPPAVTFEPPLTDKATALELMTMGHVVKVSLSFPEPFWKAKDPFEDLGFVQDPEQPFPTWWSTEPVESPLLVGWAGGPYAERLIHADEGLIQDLANDSLANALGISPAEVHRNLAGFHTHGWHADPFTRGGYSYVRPGGIEAYRELGRPLSDTLYFAGEATAGRGRNATMEGAIESGWRAARELLAAEADRSRPPPAIRVPSV